MSFTSYLLKSPAQLAQIKGLIVLNLNCCSIMRKIDNIRLNLIELTNLVVY